MFAARVTHPLRPGALGAERRAFDAALALWSDFLARQPGLESFTVLIEPEGRALSAVSIWRAAEDFRSAFEQPDLAEAGAPLMTFFAAPSAPEFPTVLHHRRGG